MKISRQLSEVAAWTAAAEIVRRHPEFENPHFFWRVGGPGPPGYYYLRSHKPYPGFEVRLSPTDVRFEGLFSSSDVGAWAGKIEQDRGIPSPPVSPATTRQSIGFRIVAELLGRNLFSPSTWTVRPGAIGWDAGMEFIAGGFHGHGAASAALWGAESDKNLTLEGFLWQIVQVGSTESGTADEAATTRDQGHSIAESPEPFWRGVLNINESIEGIWIAPQRGKAMTPAGHVIDLYDLYNDCGRSLRRSVKNLIGS